MCGEGFALYNELEDMSSSEEIIKKLLSFSIKVSHELQQLQSNSGQMIIQNAKDYIGTHYGEEELSLSLVAEHVSVSTGYLSGLFKKEAKINFVEYLTNIRMEKAMELIRNTDKKTYEIAYETGFSNPHYFSVSFKKYSGMSPSDFRSKHR